MVDHWVDHDGGSDFVILRHNTHIDCRRGGVHDLNTRSSTLLSIPGNLPGVDTLSAWRCTRFKHPELYVIKHTAGLIPAEFFV